MRISVSILAPIIWPMEALKKVAPASTKQRNRYSAPIFMTICKVREARSLMPISVTYRISSGRVSSQTVVSAAQNRSNTITHTYFLK